MQRVAVDLQAICAVDAGDRGVRVRLHVVRVGHGVVLQRVQLLAAAGLGDELLSFREEEEGAGCSPLGEALLDGRREVSISGKGLTMECISE